MKEEIGSEEWFRATEIALPDQQDVNSGRVLRTAFSGIEYSSDRPFANWTGSRLVKVADEALSRDWPALELATLLFDESRHRNPNVRAKMDALFQQAALKPVYWLLKAKEICAAIPIQTRSRCNGAVYAVLLRPADAGDYAVYIGSTGTTNFRGFPDRQSARIAQHFKGGRWAARRVGPRGQEPLWSLNLFFKKVVGSGDYLPALETSVHRELETCVKTVYGDTVD